ncbi:Uncharacterised protein [Shimwellia blattae]|nr:hypothetical protein EB105725_44_00030 [Shimwellia blattae DSM 4481 = NBRC 105725]VDY65991.1 Uncharacterised protein [Shimwellia blattae]VEC26558.1 Uncharacterised protein [Shimwellia blattae]
MREQLNTINNKFRMKSITRLLFLSATMASTIAHAQTLLPAEDQATQALIDKADSPLLLAGDISSESHTATPASTPVPPRQAAEQEHSLLPFWGDEARARGYDLPEPYGVGVSYMNIRQNIDVKSIDFTGLSFGKLPISSDVFNIGVAKTRQRSETKTMKLDAWIFPFMNVYGILGHTNGSSLSKISVDSNPANFSGFDKLIANTVHGMNKKGTLQNLDFKLHFKGTTYGAGTTLVGGYNNWFGLLDMNYTQTHFDILDGSIDAFTLSPRVGYRFTTPGWSRIHLPDGQLSVWVGSMYQDVQQEFKGSLSDLGMPPELANLMKIANQKGEGRFDVKQHLTSPWNILAGMRYDVTRNFSLTTEWGFQKRNSFFASGEFRF